MRAAYVVVACLIIALGVVHMAATARIYHSLSMASLWFFNGGVTLVLVGALNLLNQRYGLRAPGLRRACVAANVFLAIFTFVSGRVSNASVPELIVVCGMMLVAVVLASSPRALKGVP